MNCVQSPSLEWESTGKRARRVITIKLRLISTPVTVWFMAPVSPASKLQMSNTKRGDGEGNRETHRKPRVFPFLSTTLLFTPKYEKMWTMMLLLRPLNKSYFPPTDCFVVLFQFLEKRQVWGTHLFLFCWMWLCIQCCHTILASCASLDKGALHTVCAGRNCLANSFALCSRPFFFFFFCFFFFSFFEGCRAAVQFRNIRQEQMKRTCLLVGGKCQLLHIHQKCHCLFSLEVIASFSPWFWVIVEKVANRIVILKPTARLSTSAPQANLIVGKKVTCCSEIVLFNSPPPPPSTNPTVITQMLVFLFLSLFHLPSPLPFLPYLIGDFSRISAGPDGIRALQRVSVRLLLRQCDGRLRSWTGRMSRWVLFCVPLWPVSVSRVFKKKKEEKKK